MDRDEIAKKFVQIIIEKLDVSAERVQDTSKLTEDLGADSLDMAEIVMECEDIFDLKIPDNEDGIKTVGDAVDYIEQLARGKESDG